MSVQKIARLFVVSGLLLLPATARGEDGRFPTGPSGGRSDRFRWEIASRQSPCDRTSLDYTVGGSETLEYAIDDYAISRLAASLGETKVPEPLHSDVI